MNCELIEKGLANIINSLSLKGANKTNLFEKLLTLCRMVGNGADFLPDAFVLEVMRLFEAIDLSDIEKCERSENAQKEIRDRIKKSDYSGLFSAILACTGWTTVLGMVKSEMETMRKSSSSSGRYGRILACFKKYEENGALEKEDADILHKELKSFTKSVVLSPIDTLLTQIKTVNHETGGGCTE